MIASLKSRRFVLHQQNVAPCISCCSVTPSVASIVNGFNHQRELVIDFRSRGGNRNKATDCLTDREVDSHFHRIRRDAIPSNSSDRRASKRGSPHLRFIHLENPHRDGGCILGPKNFVGQNPRRNDNTHFLLMPQKIIQSLPIARHRDHSVEKPQSLARLGVFRTGTGRQASYVAGSPPNLPKKE